MSKENLIICGPWIGEFAYELNYWAPILIKNILVIKQLS